MARTSKRKIRLENQVFQEEKIEKIYRAGIYARLSVYNHNGKEISIENQIEMGKEYLKSHEEICLYDCYFDLGVTGTSFKRSGFERLMQDIRDGAVNCVIVKDFSRFGRDYIELGNFVEKVFPFMGVRFIAITDQYDSEKQVDCNETLSIHLKNIANELYARDTAKKVIAGKHIKRKQGEYLGSVPPYGYVIKEGDGKRTLVQEPVTSEIIRKIFERYDLGESLVSIVKWLYEQKIHRPSDYRKYKTVYQQEGQQLKQWGRKSIRFILTNAVYIGNLVQSGKYIKRPITAEHIHEPVISEEVFYRVRERIEANMKNTEHRVLRNDMVQNPFHGILYCGECGRKLIQKVNEKKESDGEKKIFVYYGCPNRSRMDEDKCVSEHIAFLQLRNIIFQILKKELVLSGIQIKKLTEFHKEEAKKQKLLIKKEEDELKRSVDRIEMKCSSCYLKYRNGILSQTEFLEEKKKLEGKRERNQKTLQNLQTQYFLADRETKKKNQFICSVLKCTSYAELNTDLAECLIEKIYVYRGKRVEIVWKWQDIFSEVPRGI